MSFQIFDTLLDSVFIVDENQTVLYINETAGNLLQLPPRNLLRKAPKFDSLFKFSEVVLALDGLKSVTEPTAYQEVSFTTENGQRGTVQITIQPAEGSTKNWIIYARDVTLEQNLQDSVSTFPVLA